MSEDKPKYGNKNTPTNTELLQLKFLDIITEYIELFEEKEEMECQGFVGQQFGGICEFADMFFDFLDIKYSIDNNIPKGMIVQWYDHNLQYNQDKEPGHTCNINLHAYSKGIRHQKEEKVTIDTSTTNTTEELKVIFGEEYFQYDKKLRIIFLKQGYSILTKKGDITKDEKLKYDINN